MRIDWRKRLCDDSSMKHRSTTSIVSKQFAAKSCLVAVAVLMAATSVVEIGSVAVARDYDAEIQAKREEAEKYRAEAGHLDKMASTLEGQLAVLRQQAAAIEGLINKSQREHDKLVADIATNEKKLKENQDALGVVLADLYIDDQITPLEMLASSKNIGDFLDKQEYRNSIRNTLKTTIDDIDRLQKQLEQDKLSVERVLEKQKGQQVLLADKQKEQSDLIATTRSDEAAYKKLAAESNAEAERLNQAQIAANLAAMQQSSGGGVSSLPVASSGNGGYPAQWANAPINAFVDSWGMYSRQCTSYVAFKLGSKMPGWGFTGSADAKNWPSRAAASGVATGSTPRVGAAAVSYGGPYGHVMYVEAVNGNTITVSDYNLGFDGLYRYYERPAAGLTYIYF